MRLPPIPLSYTSKSQKQGLKRPPSDNLERRSSPEVMSPSAVQQAWENGCSELERAIGHPALCALLVKQSPPRLRKLLASGRVRLVVPRHDLIGTAPWWLVHTPGPHDELEALVDLGTLLIDAGAPAAKYGVALLLHVLNAGLAAAHKASVRQRFVQAILARLARSEDGLLSSPHWLPVLCEALSLSQPPADRAACETMLKHWLQAWCDDKETCVEPRLVIEELRRALVAQVSVQRTEEEDARLMFFVEALFNGALQRKASAEAEWALRTFQQWTGHAAQLAFDICIPRMPISEELKNIEILHGQCHFKGGVLEAPLVVGKHAPELFLKLLNLANFPLRTRALLRLARHQGQEGPPVRRFGPREGERPVGVVPPRFFHELALMLLREAVELLRGPLPSLDDVSALVQAGLAYLLGSEELSPMNLKGPKHLKDLMPMLVGLLLPGSATASLDVQLMCLEVLGRWRAGLLGLEPEQVMRILRSLDVSGEAGVPLFVARMELKLSLHHLYDTVAHSGHQPNMLEMLEKVVELHEERFEPGRFNQERSMSGWTRKRLEAKNWQPQSLDDLCLLTDLIAAPEEQGRVIDHLLQYAQQPSLGPEACVQAATLLCHYTARNADTLEPTAWTPEPLLNRAIDLAWTCTSLLSRVPEERQFEAGDLFAAAALVLGSPLLEPGPAREQWEGVGDLLLKGFEEQAYSVANDVLLQLIEAHVGVARLGQRTADALVRLYLQQPECRRTITKVLEIRADRDPERAKALLRECLEAHQSSRRDQQAQALKETLRKLGFDYDWRDMSGGSADHSKFKLLLKSGPTSYVEKNHRQYVEELVRVTPHLEECGGLLTFLASHHSEIGRFATRAEWLSFRVTYGSQLTISCLPASAFDAMALRHLARYLTRHFSLNDKFAIRLKGKVLEVDATKANAYEVGQCINLLLGVLELLREMGGQLEWILLSAHTLLYRFLPSLADAPAWLNPQGVVRLVLNMEGESEVKPPTVDGSMENMKDAALLRLQSSTLDSFFLKNFAWLPCDRADRVLKLVTNIETAMNAPQRLQLGERIIAALLAAGLTERARDAAKSLGAVCSESDLTAPSQQSTAALPPWQLRARWLLLRTAWDRLGSAGSHVESFEKTFRAMALSASTDEAVHDYLDWAQSIALANPAAGPRLLENLPAPRTWHEVLRRREMRWRGFDEPSWRSVTWSLAPFGWHDKQESLSLNGKPVLFRMPFHSALVARIGSHLNEAEVIKLCIVHSRHLEPAEAPRVGAAVRIFFEKLLSMRGAEPRLPKPSDLLSEDILRGLLNGPSIPADARETLEQMLAELQELTGSPNEDLLRGLPHLIPPFFQANVREAIEWTFAMVQLLADRYPDVASKLLNQVPFDAREVQPEWESLAMRVQGLAPKAPAAADRSVPLVKEVLAPTDSFQARRVSVGLGVDALGELGSIDASVSSSVEYGNLLREYVEQIRQTEPSVIASTGGEPITLAEQCLQDLETAVGLLQQVQCRDPLSLVRGIVQSKEAPILQLIGSGRIGCRVNPRDAPDFCGVRARWQLPLDLALYEAERVYAFAKTLLSCGEPAGMSLLHVLVCQDSLDPPQRNRIVDGMFELWDMNNAAPNGTDGAWAGLLLVLEHRGLLADEGTRRRANGVRTTLLQRWRAGSAMPALAAMALIRPQTDTARSTLETLPTLEALLSRSRGQPDEDRIAMWVMRRLHHLDGKEARDTESRLRSVGAFPLLHDTKTIVEEQMRTLGVSDPLNDKLDPLKYETISHLVRLWAWCASNPADGSKAVLRVVETPRPHRDFGPNDITKAATYARLGMALPGEDPHWPQFAEEWLWFADTKAPFHPHIALAFLHKFERARLHDEWQIASKLALHGVTAMAASPPDPELTKYLAEALDKVSKQGPSDTDQYGQFDFDANTSRAIVVCEVWKRRYPAGYRILLPVAKAAAQRTIERASTPEKKARLQKYYIDCFTELEGHS